MAVPNGLSQPGGYALGAQAGEAAIRQLMTEAASPGSAGPRTAFNVVYEIRPKDVRRRSTRLPSAWFSPVPRYSSAIAGS
jgi:hypothetical protein